MSQTTDAESQTYHAVEKYGRSSGKLHPDRDCWYIRDYDDSELVIGPRERFDDEQDICQSCGGGL